LPLTIAWVFVFASQLEQHAAAAEPRVQIGAYGGYQFGGSAEVHSGLFTRSIDIEDAPSYGATIDFLLRTGAYAELSYSQQDTGVLVRGTDIGAQRYDLTLQHFTIGGVFQYKVSSSDRIRPIFGATAGVVRASTDDLDYAYDDWYFTFLLEGGFSLRIIDHLGLRFRGRLLTTFLTSDSAMFCGTAVGCSFAFSGVGLFQGDVSGGAYVAF
jgi:hypothetical protein